MHDLLTIEVVVCLDQGRKRNTQEDCCSAWAQGNRALLIVADGMGGHAGGEIASWLAVETVEEALHAALATLQPPVTRVPTKTGEPADMTTHKLPETVTEEHDRAVTEALRNAVYAAQAAIRAVATAQPEAAGEAGSTLTVALLIGRRAHIAHVGDSRAYRWHSGVLRQLTHDHSAAALLVAAGLISPAEARHHPESRTLYQFLGIASQPLVVEIVHEPLAAGDLLLLCSDGLWNMVMDEEMAALVGREGVLPEIAQALIDRANANGGKDNIAVALARMG